MAVKQLVYEQCYAFFICCFLSSEFAIAKITPGLAGSKDKNDLVKRKVTHAVHFHQTEANAKMFFNRYNHQMQIKQ